MTYLLRDGNSGRTFLAHRNRLKKFDSVAADPQIDYVEGETDRPGNIQDGGDGDQDQNGDVQVQVDGDEGDQDEEVEVVAGAQPVEPVLQTQNVQPPPPVIVDGGDPPGQRRSTRNRRVPDRLIDDYAGSLLMPKRKK